MVAKKTSGKEDTVLVHVLQVQYSAWTAKLLNNMITEHVFSQTSYRRIGPYLIGLLKRASRVRRYMCFRVYFGEGSAALGVTGN
jgi:hypothetical protein